MKAKIAWIYFWVLVLCIFSLIFMKVALRGSLSYEDKEVLDFYGTLALLFAIMFAVLDLWGLHKKREKFKEIFRHEPKAFPLRHERMQMQEIVNLEIHRLDSGKSSRHHGFTCDEADRISQFFGY
jgi:hypothetical protein